jgi:hypothetical protein
VNPHCAVPWPTSANIITRRGTIKAKPINCCFLDQHHHDLPAREQFDARSDWVGCSSTITTRRHEHGIAIPDAGILLGGVSLLHAGDPEADDGGGLVVVACPVASLGGLGHNALYIAAGFAWLTFTDDGTTGDEVTIHQSDGSYAYQVVALLCFFVFADNLLERIEGTGQAKWFGLRSGWWTVIVASGILSVMCQLLFWLTVVPAGSRRTWKE